VAEYAIHSEGLTREFATVRAVDGITMAVPAGVVFGFLGPNGAGKTTTIRLLLGLLEPTAGSANVLGFDTRTQGSEIRARSGALLEHAGLYERLSAEDNLGFYARIARMPAAAREARVKDLLQHFGLWERRREPVGKWSRGMKQKLAVARALLHRPPLIFLDEPTAGLDPVAAAALRDDLATVTAREGATVFLTTHNLPEAEKLCSLVGVIRQGRLLSLGPPRALRAGSGHPRLEVIGRDFTPAVLARLRERPEVADVATENGRLTIGLTGEVDPAPLVSLLVYAGAQVQEVHRAAPSLEEAFLALMEEPAC
jgi:ABC-2 type transport system ATP-binding protein